jgi:hypothetical protein
MDTKKLTKKEYRYYREGYNNFSQYLNSSTLINNNSMAAKMLISGATDRQTDEANGTHNNFKY